MKLRANNNATFSIRCAIGACLAFSATMMSLNYNFAEFWRQDELSDVAVVIAAPDGAELAQLPGHRLILVQCDYFRPEILRWKSNASTKRKRDTEPDNSKPRTASDASDERATAGQDAQQAESAAPQAAGQRASAEDTDDMQIDQSSTTKPRVVLTLQDAAQQPAALAVLAALYIAKPIPELLSALPQEQQLHAALLADMWQVPGVSTAAVKMLADAATANQGLSEAAYEQYLQLVSPPVCLLPLFDVLVGLVAQQTDQQSTATLKRMLLAVLGDLEVVWANPALQDTLMRLPLNAMVVLLGSDELQVASEGTVLYTADTYLSNITDLQQRQTAQQLLAPLVRAQHLSLYWLSAAAHSPSTPTLLHGSYHKQLRQLLMLKAAVGNTSVENTELQELIPGAPDSWVLAQRSIRSAPAVEVMWKLDVSTLASTAQLSASQQNMINLDSPLQTPPIAGLVFGILVEMNWQPDAQGSKVGVFAMPKNAPADTDLQYKFSLEAAGKGPIEFSAPVLAAGVGYGTQDFFELGAMEGGWDAAAWDKAGLPTTGELVLKLKVDEVTHSLNNC